MYSLDNQAAARPPALGARRKIPVAPRPQMSKFGPASRPAIGSRLNGGSRRLHIPTPALPTKESRLATPIPVRRPLPLVSVFMAVFVALFSCAVKLRSSQYRFICPSGAPPARFIAGCPGSPFLVV
jgi:hypothetical protein